MQDQELLIEKKPYQIFVHGIRTEQGDSEYADEEGRQYIRISGESSIEGLDALGASEFVNLHVIEKFDAADDGNIGGDSDDEQFTLFDNDSPRHFALIKKQILAKKWSKGAKGESDEPDATNRDGEKVPVVKLNALFLDSCIHREPIKKCYMVHRIAGEYILRMSGHTVGNRFIPHPQTMTSISKFFGGNDANPVTIKDAMNRERERQYVEAFECTIIDEMANKASKKVDQAFITSIAEQRIQAVFDKSRLAEEEGEAAVEKNAAKPKIEPTVKLSPDMQTIADKPEEDRTRKESRQLEEAYKKTGTTGEAPTTIGN